jgi:amino acid adenylation domain-containing protein
MWFAEQITPGEPVHNVSVAYRFAAPLEPGPLGAALADVIARHESLRTAFRARDGVLQQVVLAPPAAPPLRTVEVAGPPEDADAVFARLREREAAPVFDLETAPLLRALHVRSGDRDGLVVVVHHIVADAWSIGLLLADLSRAYGARAAGRGPEWEPQPVQYADFTAWQEERLAQPEAQRHLAYWRERLAGLPTLDLGQGQPRPERPSAAGRTVVVAASPDLRERLDAFARAERATPFMGVLAAYAAALGMVFGGQDLAVSSTVASRPLSEVNDVVGLFVDRVVVRLDLRGRPGFRTLLARARDAVAGAYDHDHVTFDQVVDAIQPERRLGVTPLAQATINMVPAPAALQRSGMPELLSGGQFGNGTVPHDLGLELDDEDWRLEYRPGVVADEAARRVAALLPRLLEAGLEAPDHPLCLVPALEDAELDRLRAAQDGGPAPAGPASVYDLVAAWSARTPDAPAVAGPSATLTYAGLDARARALASRLRERGVGPEEPVLLALPRSVELVVAMLGVLAAGGVYVPVDPSDPADQLAAVAAELGARLALALPGAEVGLPPSVPVLPLEIAAGMAGHAPPATPGRPENAAYVLFTSGSTGRPKGVVVEQRSLVAYVRALLDRLRPSPGAVHLMVQAPTFDSCLTAIFGALCSGGAVHVVDDEAARDPRLLAEHEADFLKITPGHLAALLAGGDVQRLRPRGTAVLGGEPCSWRLVGRLRDAGWRVLDEYGPTETTVGVLSRWQDGGGATWTATPPVGDPLPGVRVHVLDPEWMPAPPGCPGELHVAGAQVSRGYAGQPARTAEAFVPDPFGEPGGRLYRTGDLVRRLPDGTFELLGRRDRQVKVRGVRVELGAVEAALARDPRVAGVAATLLGGRLAAYVTAAGAALDPAEVRALAERVLPAAAVPATVTVLDRLPLTRHGKLDLAALPDPDAAPASGAAEAPATPTEAALAEVWRSALGVPGVGVTDRFFEVGGDSIRAIQVIAEARDRGFELTVWHLFDLQAIRPIAAALDEAAVSRPSTISTAALAAETVEALGEMAHRAYATTSLELLAAAAARELGPATVLIADDGAEPVAVRLAAGGDRPEQLVRGAKAALRGARRAGAEPGLPLIRLAGGAIQVSAPAERDGAALARDLGGALAAVVEHCLRAAPEYTAADFPDAGLDDAGLARLLAGLGVDPEADR